MDFHNTFPPIPATPNHSVPSSSQLSPQSSANALPGLAKHSAAPGELASLLPYLLDPSKKCQPKQSSPQKLSLINEALAVINWSVSEYLYELF